MDHNNSRFACFADYLDQHHRFWPLCYINCILRYSGREGLTHIEEAITAHHTSSTESSTGKDWEMLTIANFYLAALDVMLNPTKPGTLKRERLKRGPLDIAEGEVTGVEVVTIPAEVKTLEQLNTYVNGPNILKIPGNIIIAIPSYSKFPLIDGLIGYVKLGETDKNCVVWKAFQNKFSRKLPEYEIPEWIQAGFLLLSGNVPHQQQARGCALPPRWIYYDESQMKDMLCFALLPLYPV
jgi:hypothetical protein